MGAAQGQLRTNERAVESQMGIIHSETTPFAAAQFTAEANQSAGAASANLTEEDKVGQPSQSISALNCLSPSEDRVRSKQVRGNTGH